MTEDLFPPVKKISKVAQQILQKRYFTTQEKKWEDLVNRVIEFVVPNHLQKEDIRHMIANTYFVPNSPCLVNAGIPKHAGLLACFVVNFEDSIDEIIKTKYGIDIII